MNEVLEKQAALTTPAREDFAALLRKCFHYTLPKAVDGIFSVHCLKFAQDENGIDYRKPVKGLMAYLLENKRDMKTIEGRLIEKSLQGDYAGFDFECLLYKIGADGLPHLAARYINGKKRKAA